MGWHDTLWVEGKDNSSKKETGTHICDSTWSGHVKTWVVDQLGDIVSDTWILLVEFLLCLTAGRCYKKATSVLEDITGKTHHPAALLLLAVVTLKVGMCEQL